ncbi:MAG: hypothetical protein DSM106950_00180 [Stigonema ocellatum SAG 48.90 = DSM 106950]|nr:hypothetical protein [Stigonema ocellatum SAG 48.90 = DSM 106950]
MVRDSRVDLASGEFPKQSDIAKVAVYGLSILYRLNILFAVIFRFLPIFNLLHPSPWHRWMGTIHGFGALLVKVVTVYTGHLAFTVLQPVSLVLPQNHTLRFWSSFMAILGIATDNLSICAIPYRY